MYSFKGIGALIIVFFIIDFIIMYGLTLFIVWLFGITEPWAKGIIFAILLSIGSGIKLEQ